MDVPVAVEVVRGGRVESRHRVSACVVDAAGAPVLAVGEVELPVFPRSALKPLQALPLVESGAADSFAVGDAEVALACASHGGEPMHVEIVARWLERLGLDLTALACGAHLPPHEPSARALIAAGTPPSPLHNNCSGKHAGMLTLALHLGAAIDGYERPEHPVQRTIAGTVAELAGCALEAPAIDGCGAPNWPLPLRALATAMARVAAPDGLPPARAQALGRIARAMRAHPLLVAGSGRACSALIGALDVVVKTGAEGVYVAALPERGLGLALKVEDGATRASEVALMALLEALGAVPDAARAALAAIARPSLRNHAGTVVGEIRPVSGWPR